MAARTTTRITATIAHQIAAFCLAYQQGVIVRLHGKEYAIDAVDITSRGDWLAWYTRDDGTQSFIPLTGGRPAYIRTGWNSCERMPHAGRYCLVDDQYGHVFDPDSVSFGIAVDDCADETNWQDAMRCWKRRDAIVPGLSIAYSYTPFCALQPDSPAMRYVARNHLLPEEEPALNIN